MPNSDDIRAGPARLLTMLRDGLDQPPIGEAPAAMKLVLDLLGEQGGKRMAMREQIQTYLVETWGE